MISNTNPTSTKNTIPPTIMTAIDHVRRFHPEVDMVVYNDMGRWQFMGENFKKVVFNKEDNMDLQLLEWASDAAYAHLGHPSAYQAYSSENLISNASSL